MSVPQYNQFGNIQNGDTELVNMPMGSPGYDKVPRKTPFDWFILSVLGCIMFPYTGMCGVYYAWRANHGVDFNISEMQVSRHTKKAMILTIFSICLGVAFVITLLVLVLRFATVSEGEETEVYSRINTQG